MAQFVLSFRARSIRLKFPTKSSTKTNETLMFETKPFRDLTQPLEVVPILKMVRQKQMLHLEGSVTFSLPAEQASYRPKRRRSFFVLHRYRLFPGYSKFYSYRFREKSEGLSYCTLLADYSKDWVNITTINRFLLLELVFTVTQRQNSGNR